MNEPQKYIENLTYNSSFNNSTGCYFYFVNHHIEFIYGYREKMTATKSAANQHLKQQQNNSKTTAKTAKKNSCKICSKPNRKQQQNSSQTIANCNKKNTINKLLF
ncbi:hypothetical protein ACP275_04G143900 [Erythranthe tilingii]